MRILVDYDNVPLCVRSRGPLYLADRLFECLLAELGDESRVDIRLYGGWYEQAKLTWNAQDLMAKLSEFPYPMRIQKDTFSRPISINATLAQSLEVLPKKHLHGTYRQRPAARRLSCGSPQQSGCVVSPCVLAALSDFINDETCPQADCSVTRKMLLRGAGEQKLVDTMLVADLIYLSQLGEASLGVVSSDDDVWPGIISALVAGTRVLHVLSGTPNSQIGYADDLPDLQGHYVKLTM